jgi:hypothetical protein
MASLTVQSQHEEAGMQPKEGKLTVWEQRRQRYLKSGLSRKAFCAKHGLKRSTLDYWFCRIGKLQKGPGLVEVKPGQISSANSCLTLIAAERYRIEIRKGFDRQLLTEVLQALGSLG